MQMMMQMQMQMQMQLQRMEDQRRRDEQKRNEEQKRTEADLRMQLQMMHMQLEAVSIRASRAAPPQGTSPFSPSSDTTSRTATTAAEWIDERVRSKALTTVSDAMALFDRDPAPAPKLELSQREKKVFTDTSSSVESSTKKWVRTTPCSPNCKWCDSN